MFEGVEKKNQELECSICHRGPIQGARETWGRVLCQSPWSLWQYLSVCAPQIWVSTVGASVELIRSGC